MTETTKSLAAGQKKKLATIIEATQSEAGMVYMSEKSIKVLLDGEYVECNTQMQDAQGNVATRATQKGIDAMSETKTPETATAATPAPTFAIETGVEMITPTRNRSGGGGSIYPFDQLEAPVTDEAGNTTYSSFFVPATAEREDPAKSMASTVSTASKRYATEDGTRPMNRRNKETGELEEVQVTNYAYSRKFVARRVKDEAGNITGARVFRTL